MLVGLVAVVAAAAGFILILREAWHQRVSVRMIVLLAIAFHVIVLTLPLLFSRDVYSYAYYGRIWNSYGANPYVTTPSAFPNNALFNLTWPGWRGTPSVYGPLFTWLSVITTGVLRSVTSQIRGFQILAAIASLGTLFVVWRLVKRVRPERDRGVPGGRGRSQRHAGGVLRRVRDRMRLFETRARGSAVSRARHVRE